MISSEAERLSWLLLALMVAATLAAVAAAGLAVDWAAQARVAAVAGVFVALAHLYRRMAPHRPEFAATSAAAAQMFLFAMTAPPLSYAAATFGGELWNEPLRALDGMLGLDWSAYFEFVRRNPTLEWLLGLAYKSMLPQMLAAVFVLGLTGDTRSLWVYVAAVVISALATALVSALIPATDMYALLGIAPDAAGMDPGAFRWLADFQGLRDGSLSRVSLPTSQGIITFPSFHAAMGVILGWAFWRVPLARWPGVALNAALVAATPIMGGHYFVDVAAGALVAAGAIATAQIAGQRAPARAAAFAAGAS